MGSKSATATSAGSATSIRVRGATTVTLLKTVVPVATAGAPALMRLLPGGTYTEPGCRFHRLSEIDRQKYACAGPVQRVDRRAPDLAAERV
ncbi:hypothetical protein GCM10023192_45120 [Amycolatopsis samaneae]